MAQRKNTTDLTDLLLKCMSEPDPMLSMLEWLCAQLMEAEVSGIVGAEKNAHNPSRSDYRCGYRPRRLDTRMGTMYLMVPKLRNRGYIPFFVTERKRSEAALIQVIQEAFVQGVSTRKMEKLARSLGIENLSRSQVSEMTKGLNEQVQEFRSRPLTGRYPKWGAITGVVVGGAIEAIGLKFATKAGLSMNDAARIQMESGYPIDLIKQIKSIEKYNIYKEAGLYTRMVNGKLALVRDIELNYVGEGETLTNLERMKRGLTPIDPLTGETYQLHHVNQRNDGTLAILTIKEHQGNAAILNTFGKESEINREAFKVIRENFWKQYAAQVVG